MRSHKLRFSCARNRAAPGTARKVKIPHVGWNDIQIKRDASIVRGVSSGAQVYFTHSYAVEATPDTIAVTEHGETFAAIVQRESIVGIQFHPEKSGEIGLRILRNFIELVT